MALAMNRRGSVRNGVLSLLVVLAIVAGGAYLWLNRISYAPPPKTFDGPSSDLRNLTIVPTLDTPSPAGKSILWCSSFQLAWNELKSDVIREPVRIEHAESVCDRLNRAEQSMADISADSVYAAAGFDRDGIIDKIKSEMQRKFPGVQVPELPIIEDGITAFAHLDATGNFEHSFEVSPRPLTFTDSRGQQTSVTSFGTPLESSTSRYEQMLKQVRVLFATDYQGGVPSEFALDLSRHTEPNQIIVAVLKPVGTLSEMLAEMDRKIAEFQRSVGITGGFDPEALNQGESVTVPAMHWRIGHHFKELEGIDKRLLNNCCREIYLDMAYQDIEFHLDSRGAKTSSSAHLHFKTAVTAKPEGGSRRPLTHFRCDRPYLVCFKKRDAKQPFFVMWVNDAELLIPASASLAD
jgi:hypothetical protein